MQDGRFNIDNNLMEQAIRPITLGRKNYLFCGNKEGAENYFYLLYLHGVLQGSKHRAI